MGVLRLKPREPERIGEQRPSRCQAWDARLALDMHCLRESSQFSEGSTFCVPILQMKELNEAQRCKVTCSRMHSIE